jgi:hypothetical protein
MTAELLVMATFIKEHNVTVPDEIFRLIEYTISIRKTLIRTWQRIAAKFSSAAVEKSNAGHEYLIELLNDIFEALGGQEWKKTWKAKREGEAAQ